MIEIELRFRCDYFFDLDPVISTSASAKPLHARDRRNPETQADREDIFAADGVGNAISQQTNHISGHQVRDENPDEERPYSKSNERERKDNQPNTVNQPLGTTCDKLGEGDDNIESFMSTRKRKYRTADSGCPSKKRRGSTSGTRLGQSSPSSGPVSSPMSLRNTQVSHRTNKLLLLMQMLDAQNKRDDERQKATLMITSLVAQTMECFARRLVSNARTTSPPFSVERAQLECQLLRLQIEEKKQHIRLARVVTKVQIFNDLVGTGMSWEKRPSS